MKVMHSALFTMALGLSANVALAYSPENSHALPYNGGCHLMTESECKTHLSTLGQLPYGAEREAYLTAHRALLQERAALCGGSRKPFVTRASNH